MGYSITSTSTYRIPLLVEWTCEKCENHVVNLSVVELEGEAYTRGPGRNAEQNNAARAKERANNYLSAWVDGIRTLGVDKKYDCAYLNCKCPECRHRSPWSQVKISSGLTNFIASITAFALFCGIVCLFYREWIPGIFLIGIPACGFALWTIIGALVTKKKDAKIQSLPNCNLPILYYKGKIISEPGYSSDFAIGELLADINSSGDAVQGFEQNTDLLQNTLHELKERKENLGVKENFSQRKNRPSKRFWDGFEECYQEAVHTLLPKLIQVNLGNDTSTNDIYVDINKPDDFNFLATESMAFILGTFYAALLQNGIVDASDEKFLLTEFFSDYVKIVNINWPTDCNAKGVLMQKPFDYGYACQQNVVCGNAMHCALEIPRENLQQSLEEKSQLCKALYCDFITYYQFKRRTAGLSEIVDWQNTEWHYNEENRGKFTILLREASHCSETIFNMIAKLLEIQNEEEEQSQPGALETPTQSSAQENVVRTKESEDCIMPIIEDAQKYLKVFRVIAIVLPILFAVGGFVIGLSDACGGLYNLDLGGRDGFPDFIVWFLAGSSVGFVLWIKNKLLLRGIEMLMEIRGRLKD